MSIKRLRPAYSLRELNEVYATPHDHTRWADHVTRVDETIRFANEFLWDAKYVADLSCGDGAIIDGFRRGDDGVFRIKGDLHPTYAIRGPLEQTLRDLPFVDAYFCTETLEHLDDPLSVLMNLRGKTGKLIVSTPVGCWNDDNPQHYWAWDRKGVEWLLEEAGFSPRAYKEIAPLPKWYTWGIWGCE